MTEAQTPMNAGQYNAATANSMGYQCILNSALNHANIMRYFKEGRAKDLSEEPKKLLQPVILTGSGPSLDNTIKKLKEWKGGIICHYSQALTLRYYGIEPDYIVALDGICPWEGLDGGGWEKTKTKMVSHPGVWPSLIEKWPNEFLFYRQNLGKPDSFEVNEQKIMYCERLGTLEDALASIVKLKPLILTELTMFACTPPTQLFVAQVLQYGNIFLTGMDFCYHGSKERFSNYELTNTELSYKGIAEYGEKLRDDGLVDKEAIDIFWNRFRAAMLENKSTIPEMKMVEHNLPEREYIKTENGLNTDPLHLYYKANFLSACRLSMQRVFTTDKGAITELPYVDIDKVIATNGKEVPTISPEVRAKNYERYLAKRKCFCVQFSEGCAFVEVQNPIPDLTNFMVQRNRVHRCTFCGLEGVANDDKDHSDDKCQQCKQGKMKRANPCDIESNLKRFKMLLDYVEETK